MKKIDFNKYYTSLRFKIRATMKDGSYRMQRTLLKSVDADKVNASLDALVTLQEMNGFYIVEKGMGFIKMAAQATNEAIEFQAIPY